VVTSKAKAKDEASEKVVAWAMAGALGVMFLGGAALPLALEIARRRHRHDADRPKQPWDVG
jgi:hypothetical protein